MASFTRVELLPAKRLASGISTWQNWLSTKKTEHNLEILKNLEKFTNLGYLTLLGTSRKRILGEVSGENNPSDRVSGTCATSALGVMSGINIYRVHDVWQNKQAIDIAHSIKNI